MKQVGQAGEQVLLLLLLGFVRQHVLPERPAEVERLEHRVTVTRVPELRGQRTQGQRTQGRKGSRRPNVADCSSSDTHVDQSKVVFVDGELLRADVFLQGRGIGALKDQNMKA